MMLFTGTPVLSGPGVRQEEVALRFDEAIAHQSAELDLAGLMDISATNVIAL